MSVHKIEIPTPYAVGDVNAFIVKGDALTIFDVGPKTTEAYDALKWGIRAAGYQLQDIEQVVLTHHHPDHAGWVDAFPHAEIIGHEYNDKWLRHDEEFLRYHEQFYSERLYEHGVPREFIQTSVHVRRELELVGERPLTQIIYDGDEVPGHPGLKAIETLGHAQSHFIFWSEKTNNVIGGDLLLDKITPNPLIEPPLDRTLGRTKSLLQYNESLEILKQLPVKKMYTGHGADLENIHEIIVKRLERQHQQSMKVLELMGDEELTAVQLTGRLYPAIYQRQLGLTMSKTLGHLDFLEAKGFVTSAKNEAGVYLFKRK
ncbi:beta-lactamase [Lysinibacillus contaminans]|uniref:Beta-lactamase n=1 Tax=Lysinibacillus contaminans TaxID=1293441 RepID=A0ABR5K011_9BACI|nr:MBL fold metallo-hydrolase [Lysinibacillus contaminans]KOS68252.1 beta-lactamase [Lysinibacillus contaminans]